MPAAGTARQRPQQRLHPALPRARRGGPCAPNLGQKHPRSVPPSPGHLQLPPQMSPNPSPGSPPRLLPAAHLELLCTAPLGSAWLLPAGIQDSRTSWCPPQHPEPCPGPLWHSPAGKGRSQRCHRQPGCSSHIPEPHTSLTPAPQNEGGTPGRGQGRMGKEPPPGATRVPGAGVKLARGSPCPLRVSPDGEHTPCPRGEETSGSAGAGPKHLDCPGNRGGERGERAPSGKN